MYGEKKNAPSLQSTISAAASGPTARPTDQTGRHASSDGKSRDGAGWGGRRLRSPDIGLQLLQVHVPLGPRHDRRHLKSEMKKTKTTPHKQKQKKSVDDNRNNPKTKTSEKTKNENILNKKTKNEKNKQTNKQYKHKRQSTTKQNDSRYSVSQSDFPAFCYHSCNEQKTTAKKNAGAANC